MIALPFPGDRPCYRLLVNQYDEELSFSYVDKGVPNRGIPQDQFLVTLDYEQKIHQINAADFPESSLAGNEGLLIHHEPGLWLHMINETTNEINVGRLATIPHGDSVLALGKSSQSNGGPEVPDISGLPIGVPHDLDDDYLKPYKHFTENLFEGLFDPVKPNELLKEANLDTEIARTTKLEVDTSVETGGIVNIPFIVKQANAV